MKSLIACSKDSRVSVWSTKKYELKGEFNLPEIAEGMAYFNHEKTPYLILGGESGILRLFNVNEGCVVQEFELPML